MKEKQNKVSLPAEAGNEELIRRFHALPLGAQYVVRVERLAKVEKNEFKRAKLESTSNTLERLLREEDRPFLASFRNWEASVMVRRKRTIPLSYQYND